MTTIAPGLQTHFNAPISRDTLMDLALFGVRWCRVDAQACDTATLTGMVADVESMGMDALPIVYDLDRLRGVPTGNAEWSNEPDGDILPAVYRDGLDAACALALELGIRLWGPCISNLDRDSLRWMELVRAGGWPDGLYGITVHRYGNGTFLWAHDGFDSREAEVEALLALCDGRPFMVTEFGYPSTPTAQIRRGPKRTRFLAPDLQLTEDQQAANIAKEWEFWRRYTDRPFLYQINDPPDPDDGCYGIRACAPDGTLTYWKPSAYTFPKESPMAALANVSANTVFAKEDLVEVPGRAGEFGVRCPPGADTILSPKTSGQHELRDMSSLGGPDETCRVQGDLVYFPMNAQGGRFAWRLADADAE